MTSLTPERKLNVAIVGGGMAGLALALSLSAHEHISLHIYEAAHAFSEIGAGVALGPNAQRALNLISPEAGEAFSKLVTHNGWEELRDVFFEYRVGQGKDAGKLVAATKNEVGQCTVHRAKFLDAFVKLVPEGVAQFGKRLVKLEKVEGEEGQGGVKLHFKDGSSTVADCVVGADGIHSVVRSYLLGRDHEATNARFTGSVAYRELIPMDKAIEAIGERFAQNSTIWFGHGAAITAYPIDHGETLNLAALTGEHNMWDGAWVQHADYGRVVEEFAGWSEDAKKVVKLLDSPQTMAWSMWDHAPAPTFCGGNVVMIGDAAHASTPFQGQGAGQGIEDAFVLGSLFAHLDEPGKAAAAFKAYDAIRRPRAIKVCQTSREAGELVYLRLPGVEDNLDAFKENIEERMNWMWNRDVAGERDEAMAVFEKLLRGEEIQA